jgi:hypothetical protein
MNRRSSKQFEIAYGNICFIGKNQEYANVIDLAKNDIRRFMNEYVNFTTKKWIKVEFISVIENTKTYSNLCRYFGILPANYIIITNGNIKVLVINEFYKIHNDSVVAFRGEQVVTSSLKELSSTDRYVRYFLVGHGEYELGSVSFSKGL